MNKRKVIKGKIADDISQKYLSKRFRNLSTNDRIIIYSFTEKLLTLMQKNANLDEIKDFVFKE